MTDPRNVQPGFSDVGRDWSGNPPTSHLSGDGSVFWGVNIKDTSGVMWYIVYSVAADGTRTPRLKLGPNGGQGALAVDAGYLILSYFEQVSDGQPKRRIAVPGWVRDTSLEQRVTAIENAAGLSADDRAALDDLKRMLRAVRG
jgi:hypothetical protein